MAHIVGHKGLPDAVPRFHPLETPVFSKCPEVEIASQPGWGGRGVVDPEALHPLDLDVKDRARA